MIYGKINVKKKIISFFSYWHSKKIAPTFCHGSLSYTTNLCITWKTFNLTRPSKNKSKSETHRRYIVYKYELLYVSLVYIYIISYCIISNHITITYIYIIYLYIYIYVCVYLHTIKLKNHDKCVWINEKSLINSSTQ